MGIQIFQRERGLIASSVVADRLLGEWEYPILPEVDDVALDVIVDDVELDGTGALMKSRLRSDAADREIVFKADAHRARLMRDHGFRSFLRVPLWRGSDRIGALLFAAVTPARFDFGQAETARRVGDHIALALAHKHLAEEAERAAEARARAALLEEREGGPQAGHPGGDDGHHRAPDRRVGHRQGGGRATWCSSATAWAASSRGLLVLDPGDGLWRGLLGSAPDAEQRQRLSRVAPYLDLEPMPEVSRAVFLASPHRGAPLAGGQVGRFASRLIRLPGALMQEARAIADVLEGDAPAGAARVRNGPDSVDFLSDRRPYLHTSGSCAPRESCHNLNQNAASPPLAFLQESLG